MASVPRNVIAERAVPAGTALSAPRKGHEESPPTVRAGDRAQVRGGRPPALEQKRDPSPRLMMRANPEQKVNADKATGS